MATYGFFDVFLGFAGLGFTAWRFISLISHVKGSFHVVRDSCKSGVAHPKRGRLLWQVTLTVATWLLAAAIYARDISAIWEMMEISRQNGGSGGLAFAIMDSYLFFLAICGFLTLVTTAWLLYHNKREMADLVIVIRFNAKKYQSVADVESRRDGPREPHGTANPMEVYLSRSSPRATSAADQQDSNQWSGFDSDGVALHHTPSSSGSNAEEVYQRIRFTQLDRLYIPPDSESDIESCPSCISEYTRTIPSTRPAENREPLSPTSPTRPSTPFASDADADADAENTDPQSQRRLDPNRKQDNGIYVVRNSRIPRPRPRQGKERCCTIVNVLEPRHSIEAVIEGPEEAGARPECFSDRDQSAASEGFERLQALGVARNDLKVTEGFALGNELNDDDGDEDVSLSGYDKPRRADPEARNNNDVSASYGSYQDQGTQTGLGDAGRSDDIQEGATQPGREEAPPSERPPEQDCQPTFAASPNPCSLPRHPRVEDTVVDERGHRSRHSPRIRLRRIETPWAISAQPLGYTEPRAPTAFVDTHPDEERPGCSSVRDGGGDDADERASDE